MIPGGLTMTLMKRLVDIIVPGVQLPYSQEVLADNPVGYWRFNESSGSIVTDSSGNGRDGTLVGATLGAASLIDSDPANKAIALDGDGDYITIPHNAAFDTPSRAYEIWFTAPDTIPGDSKGIIGKAPNTGWSRSIFVIIKDATGELLVNFTNGTDTLDSIKTPVSICDGQTHHVVANVIYSASGDTVELWLDGVLVDSLTITYNIDTDSANLEFGRYSSSSLANRYYEGILDEAAIYGHSLSQARIEAHYAAAFPLFYATSEGFPLSGLLAYWSFDEGYGTTVNDLSGNGHNGALTSASSWTSDGFVDGAIVGGGDNYLDLGVGSNILNIPPTDSSYAFYYYHVDDAASGSTVIDLGYRSSGADIDNVGFNISVGHSSGAVAMRVQQGSADAPPGGQSRGRWLANVNCAPGWNLIAVNRSPSKAGIYVVNTAGTQYDSLSGSFGNFDKWASRKNLIGASTSSFSDDITGYWATGRKIDGLGVWDRTLSSAEVSALWSEGAGVRYGVNTDPYFDNVSALLHMDGTDASTTFVDETGKTWTASDGAQIDTAQSQFGGASGLFSGSSDRVYHNTPAEFLFGSGDFTVEAFVRVPSITSAQAHRIIVGVFTATGDERSWFFSLDANGKVSFAYSTTGANTIGTGPSAGAITANTWHHVAASRIGNDLFLTVGGDVGIAKDVTGITFNDASTSPRVGDVITSGGFGIYTFDGHIDNLRITKGVGRYTANFTPPIAAFPNVGPEYVVVSLFETASGGAYYDPSVASSVWQDSAGTVPALSGDPVGRIDDLSGFGNHMVQTDNAYRPTLISDATGTYLKSTTVEAMEVPSSTGSFKFMHDGTGGTYLMGAYSVDGGGSDLSGMLGNNNGSATQTGFYAIKWSDERFYSYVTATAGIVARTNTAPIGSWPVGEKVVIGSTLESSATDLRIYKNNEQTFTATNERAFNAGNAATNLGLFKYGSNPQGSNTSENRIYGLFLIDRVLDTSEQTVVNDYLSFLMQDRFTPAELFNDGEVGAWYEPSDLSTVWTDAGKTTNAGDTDTVYWLDDKSGNGLHLGITNAAYRPQLNLSSGKWQLDFDGSNDRMSFGSNDIFRNIDYGLIVLGVADNSSADANTRRLLNLEDSAGNTFGTFFNTSSGVASYNGRRVIGDSGQTENIESGGFVSGAIYIAHLRFADGEIDIYRNGVLISDAVTFASAGTTADTAALSFTLGARRSLDAYSQYFNGALGPTLIVGRNTEFTSQEISDCSTYFEDLV